MSKYVIDTTLDNVKKVIAMGVTKGGAIWTDTTDIENLEELNSDYINEHFGSLQDDAYKRELEDAWEAARKIAEMWETIDNDELLGIFGLTAKIGESTIGTLFKKQTAAEAIEKLKAYEEKQKADGKIEVGDEVKSLSDSGVEIEGLLPWVVTTVDQGDYCQGIDSKGEVHATKKVRACKTGRHFDIEKILEAMKHD